MANKRFSQQLSALIVMCVAATTVVFGLTGRIVPQTQAVTVGVLSFQNDSGVDAPAELGQRLTAQLRQRLNTSYKDLVARPIAPGGDPPAAATIEQLIGLARQSGVKAIVRGGILALDSETVADETKVSMQLYADVIRVESGDTNTVRVEGTGQQKGTASALRIDAGTFSGSGFSSSALGLALSNAVEQLTVLIHQSLALQVSQPVSTGGFEAQPAAVTTDAQQDASLSADEELKQLIAQAEALLANPAAIKPDSATSLDRAVRALKDALASKASRLEKAMDTSEADVQIAARKEELQTVLGTITTEAASAGTIPGAMEAQPSGQKKSVLATISEYLGESTNLLQKIQEFRAAFRSANEDTSQFGAVATTMGAEATPPTEEATGGVDGVVTESGNPVEGLTVTDVESGATATTDATGSYKLNGLIAGKIAKLIFEQNGKQIGSGEVDVPRGRPGVADLEVTAASTGGATRVFPSMAFINGLKLRPGVKTGKLQGVVEDTEGRPVVRALVQLKNLAVARTDSRGRYAFYNVPAGAHQLMIQSSGFSSKSEQVQMAAADSAERRTRLALVISPQVHKALILRGAGATLRGVVRDTENRFVGAAKVTALQGTQALTVFSGSQGGFELRDLKPGSYRAVISKAGFETWSQPIELRSGRDQQIDIRLRRMTGVISSLIQAQRARQGEIRGQVRWSSGEPVVGAMVELRPVDNAVTAVRTSAGSKGEYAMKVLEGRYEVKVIQGAQAVSKVVAVRAAGTSTEDFTFKRLDVASALKAIRGPVTGRPTASVQQTALIAGRVTTATNGAPVAGAIVAIESRAVRRSARTDQRGDYSFEDLPPDRYRVSVTLASFSREEKEVVARASVSTRQDFVLKAETRSDNRAGIGGIRLPGLAVEVRKGQIGGRVIDSATGRPIAGATVGVGGQRPVMTDSQGSFLVSGLAPGNYRVSAAMRGYANGDLTIVVRSGETAAANFRLAPNGLPPVRRQ